MKCQNLFVWENKKNNISICRLLYILGRVLIVRPFPTSTGSFRFLVYIGDYTGGNHSESQVSKSTIRYAHQTKMILAAT